MRLSFLLWFQLVITSYEQNNGEIFREIATNSIFIVPFFMFTLTTFTFTFNKG